MNGKKNSTVSDEDIGHIVDRSRHLVREMDEDGVKINNETLLIVRDPKGRLVNGSFADAVRERAAQNPNIKMPKTYFLDFNLEQLSSLPWERKKQEKEIQKFIAEKTKDKKFKNVIILDSRALVGKGINFLGKQFEKATGLPVTTATYSAGYCTVDKEINYTNTLSKVDDPTLRLQRSGIRPVKKGKPTGAPGISFSQLNTKEDLAEYRELRERLSKTFEKRAPPIVVKSKFFKRLNQ